MTAITLNPTTSDKSVIDHNALLITFFNQAIAMANEPKEVPSLVEAAYGFPCVDMGELGSKINDSLEWTHPEDPNLPHLFTISSSVDSSNVTMAVYDYGLIAVAIDDDWDNAWATRID